MVFSTFPNLVYTFRGLATHVRTLTSIILLFAYLTAGCRIVWDALCRVRSRCSTSVRLRCSTSELCVATRAAHVRTIMVR